MNFQQSGNVSLVSGFPELRRSPRVPYLGKTATQKIVSRKTNQIYPDISDSFMQIPVYAQKYAVMIFTAESHLIRRVYILEPSL
jgi:hypothetical protein